MQTTVIIGGGVIGLNIALAIAEARPADQVWLLEREPYLGHHTTTRNSEVVHAGVAYPPDSLKAKLCVEGNRLTHELAQKLGVPLWRSGKYILATDDAQAQALEL